LALCWLGIALKIAVVGAGISGNLAARLLATKHEVALFEAGDYLGGHANTVEVSTTDGLVPVDTGFMVFNSRTYPNFCRMLELLDVETQPSDMSFSVRCDEQNLEYNGTSVNGLFAQRSNLVRPAFYGMLREIVRFNRIAREAMYGNCTLGKFIRQHGFAESLQQFYLRPMLAAIWSAPLGAVDALPAKFVLGFMHNHGLLQIRDRPQWRTIVGGAKNYVDKLLAPIASQTYTNTSVAAIHREASGVLLQFASGQREHFDQVVLGTHADTSLKLLAEPTADEREILNAFPYQSNKAVLHSDTSVMPRRKRAWASWNYHLAESERPVAGASVTYDLNRLQNLTTKTPVLVTLNPTGAIDREKVWQTFDYSHPGFTQQSIGSQQLWGEISGARRTWFCGAYWGYGFHEDGVNSALKIAKAFGVSLDDIKLPISAANASLKASPLAVTS